MNFLVPDGIDLEMEPRYALADSGLALPVECIRPSRPTGIDLFCGIGGFSLGFMQAGFEIVAAVDNEASAAITYAHNLCSYPCQFHFIEPHDEQRFEDELQKGIRRRERERKKEQRRRHRQRPLPIDDFPVCGDGWLKSPEARRAGVRGCGHFFFGDVRKITGAQILKAVGKKPGEIDCVMGGPPCQGFSIAGKRNVLDPRNDLVFEFVRLVLEIRPKTMVFENVPGIVSMVTHDGVPVIDKMCRILEDGGFGKYESLRRGMLETAGCGAAMRGSPRKKSKRRTKPQRHKVATP